MVEVVEHLLVTEALLKTQDDWRIGNNVETLINKIPEELKEFINQQINRLEPEYIEVLERASLVGLEFSPRVFPDTFAKSREEIDNVCAELVDRGQFLRFNEILELDDGSQIQRFGFIHRLHQEALRERIPPARRAKLHLETALRGEELFKNNPQRVAAELASMFERGKDYGKTVHYLHLSAQRALEAGALAEAKKQLSRGYELLEHLTEEEQSRYRAMLNELRESVFETG